MRRIEHLHNRNTLEVFVCPIFGGILCRNPTEMLEISDEESNLDDVDSPKRPPLLTISAALEISAVP